MTDVRILFVCAGNTCRSPLAEGVMGRLLADAGVPAVVASAGTHAREGAVRPDPRANRVARARGVLLDTGHPRRFDPADFDRYERIVALDAVVFDQVRASARSAADLARVSLIRIADPWDGDDSDYERAYDEIAVACERVLTEL